MPDAEGILTAEEVQEILGRIDAGGPLRTGAEPEDLALSHERLREQRDEAKTEQRIAEEAAGEMMRWLAQAKAALEQIVNHGNDEPLDPDRSYFAEIRQIAREALALLEEDLQQ